ncbi:MAG: LLM class F420-dependent oxidoreductase [Alphaproteobacteria bacterium]|nr:LLM class F420-dependent oxidoreductase [Alphaproteobacteria bacterium]|tara:strand:+ start:535 stop:1371 length:837 start_codon:yes stop_codon:yes gene_type:complete
MHKGIFFFPTDYAIEVPELAKELEDRGFESLFLCEHTHIPTSRKSPFPGGGELPQHYIRTHDPFVALSFAASVTKKLMLGTGICLVIQRDPIVTANTIASLDMLSGGRFIFGAGGGWNLEEMENHGTDPKTRFKLLRERLLAMKAMWTEEEASFHGDYVNIEPSWCYPKPVQKPHPPIILGGETVHTLRRIVEFCDGWLPRAGPAGAPAETMAKLKAVADEAGRDMSTLSTTIFRPQPDAALLDEYEQEGATRVLLEMPSVGRDDALKTLDEYAALMN